MTTSPPPKPVPDRPSELTHDQRVILAMATTLAEISEACGLGPDDDPECILEVIEELKAKADAAAPPAEAPAERGDVASIVECVLHKTYMESADYRVTTTLLHDMARDVAAALAQLAAAPAGEDGHMPMALKIPEAKVAAPAAPAEGVSRADAEVMVDGIIETAWLEGSEHRKAWGQRLMDLRNELVRTLTAPRVTGGRAEEWRAVETMLRNLGQPGMADSAAGFRIIEAEAVKQRLQAATGGASDAAINRSSENG